MYLSIQDHTGDRKLKIDWDPKDPMATKHIQEMFIDLQKNGYRFFSVKKVLGLFEKKGKEVKTYDPTLGELIYEQDGNKQAGKNVAIHQIEEANQHKYEEPKRFNPSEDTLDDSRDYVATKPLVAG